MQLNLISVILLFGTIVGSKTSQPPQHTAHDFPDTIPIYDIRRDKYTNEPVSRGRLPLINYDATKGMIPLNDAGQKAKMVKYSDFDKLLQCASPEPELDGNRGTWSMIKMAPPSKASIELICAYAETKCEPWVSCRDKVAEFKQGDLT